MSPVGVRVTSIALCGLTLWGCGGAGGIACTLVGCNSGVSFQVTDVRDVWPKAAKLRLCVAALCQTRAADIDGSQVRMSKANTARQLHATLEVTDARGVVLSRTGATTRLHKEQPNGQGCGPICYEAGVRFDGQSRRLVTASHRTWTTSTQAEREARRALQKATSRYRCSPALRITKLTCYASRSGWTCEYTLSNGDGGGMAFAGNPHPDLTTFC